MIFFNLFIYETRRVVVPDCLCVTEGLEEGVGLEDDVLHAGHLCAPPAHGGNVLHDKLASLCLSGTRLTRDDDAVVGCFGEHVTIHIISNRIYY